MKLTHLSKYKSNFNATIKETKNISSRIVRAFNSQFNGKSQTAINTIINLVNKYKQKLITEILDSHAFLGNAYYENKPLKELFLYKGRIGNPYQSFSCEDMYHIPLNLRKYTKTQRYSMPGIPCIYLAQNSYVVWKEMQMPSFDSLSISAFKITNKKLKLIDLTYPFEVVSEILNNPEDFMKTYDDRSAKIIIDSISLFPLVAAVSIKCKDNNRNFKSEYVIPQLLMYCLKGDVIGIAYHSNEISTDNHMYATNIAIPIINYDKNDKYGKIKNDIFVTEPLNFDYFDKAYNNAKVLTAPNIFDNGIGKGNVFSTLGPLSTFNKLISGWTFASYEKDIEYSKTPFYLFDDYLLHLKAFIQIK